MGIKEWQEGPHKVKKFASIGVDLKKYLLFILCKMLLEAQKCYKANDNQFDSADKVTAQVRSYVDAHFDCDGLTPFIVDVGELVPVEQFIDEDEILDSNVKDVNLVEYLCGRIQRTFRGGRKNRKVNAQLTSLLECYDRFLKILAILFMDA